jgi:integrase
MASLEDEKPRAKNQTKARILDIDDVKLLIEKAPANYRALLATAVFSGMRQSELLGLRWCDVDFAENVIHIEHQLSRASRVKPAELLPLKTDAAERTIDLAPPLASVLREHKLASKHSRDEDYVFCSEIGSPLYYRNVTRRGLEKAADAAKLNADEAKPRLSFHDLRHTAITHLIRSGADVAQVQRFAGHSKPSITLDIYVGEFEGRQQNDAGQRLAALYADVLG